MKALGRHDMGFDEAKEGRIQRGTNRSHDHGRQRDRHALQSVAFGRRFKG
jgi:hypothetical protein